MKLKEKLADEYSITSDKLSEYKLMSLAYLAGFEKAREMAGTKILGSVDSNIPVYINQRLQSINDYQICCNLGEEEV